MRVTIAAVRTGRDPVGKLPEAAFHRQLEEQIVCPKCDATYNLIVDFEASVGRFFAEESRRPLMLLRKAVMMGHASDHRVEHFESSGVVVTSFPEAKGDAKPPASQGSEARSPRRTR